MSHPTLRPSVRRVPPTRPRSIAAAIAAAFLGATFAAAQPQPPAPRQTTSPDDAHRQEMAAAKQRIETPEWQAYQQEMIRGQVVFDSAVDRLKPRLNAGDATAARQYEAMRAMYTSASRQSSFGKSTSELMRGYRRGLQEALRCGANVKACRQRYD